MSEPEDGTMVVSKKWVGGLVSALIVVLFGAFVSFGIENLSDKVKEAAQVAEKAKDAAEKNSARIEKHEAVVDQCVTNIKDDISEMKTQMKTQTDAINEIRESQSELSGLLKAIARDLNND